MSRSRRMGRAAMLGLLWGLSSPAMAGTVNVTVVGGAVVASPVGELKSTDDTVVFQLATPGYSFPAVNAVSVMGAGASLRCSASSKTAVTCKQAGKVGSGQQIYVVRVQPEGSSETLQSEPNIWVQSE